MACEEVACLESMTKNTDFDKLSNIIQGNPASSTFSYRHQNPWIFKKMFENAEGDMNCYSQY